MSEKHGRIIFPVNYFKKCFVQQSQNEKFFRFVTGILKRFSFRPVKTLELGAGDTALLPLIKRIYDPEAMYVVDINEDFVKREISIYEGVKGVVKDITELFRSDFDCVFDLVWSSNTFHWLPFNTSDGKMPWLTGVRKVFDLLNEGGFFFVHQGLKWTYFPLYDLAGEFYFKKYGKRIDLNSYLYYPTRKEILHHFKSTGFKVVDSKCFYEYDSFDIFYTAEHLYKSFSVAGLNAFLSEIKNEAEREEFRKDFIKTCEYYEPPVFSHRGFFALRKPYKNLRFQLITPGNYTSSIRDFIRDVSDDFIPPLSTRTPESTTFRMETAASDEDFYFEFLAKNYFSLCAHHDTAPEKILGILSFTIKESFCFPGKKCVYISTIAVSSSVRRAGIGDALLKGFFECLPEILSEKGNVALIETRTWSTNEASLNLFKKAGFSECEVIKDHREKGIDTVYLVNLLK